MKLKDLFAVTTGAVKWSVSESEEPLCGHDFWLKYRMSQEWEKEIGNVSLIPRSKSESGLWHDEVICLVTLKQE